MTKQSHDGVTIYDVARLAGVAASTVSRTFARPGRVNVRTAAKVRQAAEELGYAPPAGGPQHTQPVARLIGLMVSDVANPFFSPVIRGAQITATELGFEVLLADSRESASREQAALERLAPVVQGFVIGNTRMPDSALRSIAQQRPTVVLNRALSDVSCVIPDNRGGIQAALQLLFDLGHREVHYVAGPEASWPDGVRWRAVQEFGDRIGLTVHRVGPTLPTFDGGLGATEQLLPLRPSAVIGYNDLIAVGVLHGLLRSGLRVPQDVSVVGFDDILISRLVLPTLTTIAAPMRQMGTTALHNVVAVINGAKPQATEPMVMPVRLKVRGSTGPGPAYRAPGIRA